MSRYIATFHTHLSALLTCQRLTAAGVRARMMPVPRKLSASCGTCVDYEASGPLLEQMDTDVISGLESGMSTVLVLSGVSTRQTVETYAYQPNVILDGVGDIARLARKNKK